MAQALERIGASKVALGADFPAAAVSAAYYAALYAARAALSEENLYAKTHRGVWSLFGEVFVLTGRFDEQLTKATRAIQELREAGDYDAREILQDEAERTIAFAERFVDAVDAFLAA
jgi:uncharacterized protein (UPF0332 family)